MSAERKVLFIDGEGPLVNIDLAREMAARIHRIYEPHVNRYLLFDTLSLYNACLAEEGRSPNQPGDTLALLVPHLLAHGVSNEDLVEEAKKTVIIPGVQELLGALRLEGWEIRVISGAYNHLWETVGPRLGFSSQEIASSHLNLAKLRENSGWREDLSNFVKLQERLTLQDKDDIEFAQLRFKKGEGIFSIWREYLSETWPLVHNFYGYLLPDQGFDPLKEISIVGGSRKVDAVQKFQKELAVGVNQIVFVGDSITDDQAHKFVRESGGLAITLNGDRFALRNANLAVALEDRLDLKPLLDAWQKGGLVEVRNFVEAQSTQSTDKERLAKFSADGTHFSLVTSENVTELAEIHRDFRERSRDGAVPLI